MDAILVGNSVSILGSGQGEFIDSFPTIIRLNGGVPNPTTYSGTGSKTHYWSFSASEVQYGAWASQWEKVPMIMFLNKRCEKWLPPNVRYTWDEKNYADFITDFGYERPSTGLLTAQHVTQVLGWELTAVGFDGFQSKTWYRAGNAHGPHRGKQEIAYMEKLGVKIL